MRQVCGFDGVWLALACDGMMVSYAFRVARVAQLTMQRLQRLAELRAFFTRKGHGGGVPFFLWPDPGGSSFGAMARARWAGFCGVWDGRRLVMTRNRLQPEIGPVQPAATAAQPLIVPTRRCRGRGRKTAFSSRLVGFRAVMICRLSTE